jgi:hypothetical protein
MRKLFLFIGLLHSTASFSQIDSIYARIEIKSVSWEEHRTWIDTSIIITFEKLGKTEIINLGMIDGIEIGLQWELLKSRLGEKEVLVNGKAYYLKREGKWEMHQRPTYAYCESKIVSEKPLTMPVDDYGGSSSTIQGLQLEYRERYFIIK